MRYFFIFIISVLLFWNQQAAAHTEEVGQLIIENFQNELYITAILDKRALSYALMSEGDCPPKEMLSKCGNDYFKEHVKIKINGVEISLDDITMVLGKGNVTFHYQIKGTFDSVQTIAVESDYMLQYSDHAKLKVAIDLADFQRTYSMHKERNTINIQTDLLL